MPEKNKRDYRAELEVLFEYKQYPPDSFNLQDTFYGKNIVLYGAGVSSIWFFEIIKDIFGYAPSLVLDKRFEKPSLFHDVPARSPDEFNVDDTEAKQSVVVICHGNPVVAGEMTHVATKLGYTDIIHLRDIYPIHNPFSQPDYAFDEGIDFFLKRKRDILLAFELMEDSMSQEVFLAYLSTHMLRKPEIVPSRPEHEQYFPSDIVLNKGYRSFVNIGSYDGDVVRSLHANKGKVDEIVCLEADPDIFKRLHTYLESASGLLASNVVALPCAAYSDERVVNYTSATGLGSRISEHGSLKVQAISLDHVLPNLAPTMISMDIEGAEPEALKGAERLIATHSPDLAICVYHSPEHVWQIPLYLASLDLGYRFYLRNYTSFCTETVLYATL